MGKKKYIIKKNKQLPLISIFPFLFAAVVILTVGYSTTSFDFTMSNITARIMVKADIRITDLTVLNTINGVMVDTTDYSVDRINSDVNLPNSDSTVTYQIQVTNIGNVEMGIREITGLPSNLTYTLNGYTLEATLCDSNNNSKCKLGSVTTFEFTVGYADNGYDSSNTQYNLDVLFDFYEMIYTARIGDHYYETIQDAIDDSPTDHTETTIVLLKNTYDRIKIWAGNNIVLDMPNLVLHNKEFAAGSSGDPVVEILGSKNKDGQTVNLGGATFKMINGTISTAANQAAINCEKKGEFIMTGGSIIATGNRQAVYIKDGASAEISGTAYLRSRAELDIAKDNYRGTVHVVSGTLTITGGTIESDGGGGIALTNESVTTIGAKDGNLSTTVPTFIGKSIGMHLKANSTLNFYDGIVMGGEAAFYNESEIDDTETGYNIVHSADTIGSNNYDTAYLGQDATYTITLDPQDGTLSDTTRNIVVGSTVGPLPIPTKTSYAFDGWYTQGGDLVTPNTPVTGNVTYYAHWTLITIQYAAKIGNNKYQTLAAAVSAVPANTPTTIELLEDRSEKITIANNMNITLDFGSYTLSNPDNSVIITNNGTLTLISGTIATTASTAVVTNNGTFTMTGGTITSSASNTSAVNNSVGANLIMSGGSIIATGQRQAIYDSGGTVRISGTAYLSASAKVESNKFRGTVQNENAASNIIITGGTIVSTANNGIGVSNVGTLTIGEKDGIISTTSPVIRGPGRGVYNTKTFNFYDGVLQSTGTPLSGNTTEIEDGSVIATSDEVIDNKTYHKVYLNIP